MDINDRKLCLCTALHTSCNPNTCGEAAARKAARLVIPPRSSIPSPRTHNAAVEATVEELRRASNRGCWTCSLLYYATGDTFGDEYRYNDIDAKVWYGSGHLELSNKDIWGIDVRGTIFVESGR
jgi:hypothetical protein